MNRTTKWMFIFVVVIVMIQVFSLNGLQHNRLSLGSWNPLTFFSGQRYAKETEAAQNALIEFMDAWMQGNTQTLSELLVVPGQKKETGNTINVQSVLGRYRLGDYQLEGEISDLAASRQNGRRTFSCRVVIPDMFGYYAYRLLPEMILDHGRWVVNAESMMNRTPIPLTEYEQHGNAVHEQM